MARRKRNMFMMPAICGAAAVFILFWIVGALFLWVRFWEFLQYLSVNEIL